MHLETNQGAAQAPEVEGCDTQQAGNDILLLHAALIQDHSPSHPGHSHNLWETHDAEQVQGEAAEAFQALTPIVHTSSNRQQKTIMH